MLADLAKYARSSPVRTLHSAGSVPAGGSDGTAAALAASDGAERVAGAAGRASGAAPVRTPAGCVPAAPVPLGEAGRPSDPRAAGRGLAAGEMDMAGAGVVGAGGGVERWPVSSCGARVQRSAFSLGAPERSTLGAERSACHT